MVMDKSICKCSFCGESIKWNGLLWVSVDVKPFPQYCSTRFHSRSNAQLHIPNKHPLNRAVYPNFILKKEIYAEDIEEAILRYLETLGIMKKDLDNPRFEFLDGNGWSTTKVLKIRWR
jgi:hypothetical protein